jgi:hypothetical protein
VNNLTPAQKTTLRDWIAQNHPAAENTVDGSAPIAAALNAFAAPDHWAYKSRVSRGEIGDAVVATEIAGMSALNLQRLQCITGDLSDGEINPTLDDRRAAFDSIFSGAGGSGTRASLAILWRRRATVAEKLFAAGTGSTASPAKLAVGSDGRYVEGTFSAVDIWNIRNP